MRVESGTFGPIEIAVSGMRASNRQMEVVGSNIANIQTTDAGNGQPYRRLIPEFKTGKDGGTVEVDGVIKDMSDFQRVLNPGHPAADEDGYVAMPNVDWPTEMVNLNVASRTYQANAAVLKRYQRMVDSSLELLR